MRKLVSIAAIGVFQGIRAQTFWISGLLCAFLLAITFLLRVLTIGETGVVLRTVCLSAMELSSLLLVVFGFVFGFFKERDSRLRSIYLTYFSPSQYLLGKLAGICLVVAMYLGVTSLLGGALLLFEGALSWSFFLGAYSVFLKLCILSAFCLLFSCLFESPIMASLVTVFSYVACELSYYSLSVMNTSQIEWVKWFYRVIYHLLPMTDKLDLKYQAIHGLAVPGSYLFEISVYVPAYMAVLFLLSVWAFTAKGD